MAIYKLFTTSTVVDSRLFPLDGGQRNVKSTLRGDQTCRNGIVVVVREQSARSTQTKIQQAFSFVEDFISTPQGGSQLMMK